MNKNAKRLLSLVLCLMMVLSVLPVVALAADTLRVYCQAPENWKNCNVYWWGSSASNPSWPGEAMSADEDGIWFFDIPADASNVIFTNGSGSQSADLVTPTDDKVMYIYNTKTWDVYGKQDVEEPIVADFYVAGEEGLCGSNWSPDDGNNGLFDKDGDGIYTKTYENVAAGTYQLKVTDGTWNNSWGAAGGSDNYILNVETAGSVEIRFDSNTHLITVKINGQEITEDIPEPPAAGYYVAGSFNGWNPADENYIMTSNDETMYYLDIVLAAGTYSLKVTDGTWNNAWGGTGEGGNYDLLVIEEGVVTIAFDAANGIVTVTGDCLGEIVKDPLEITTIHVAGTSGLVGAEWEPALNQMPGENGIYTITFTGIAAGTYDFKFVANGAWDINWGAGCLMESGVAYDAWFKATENCSVEVPADNATVTLILDLSAMDLYTGNGAKCTAVVECEIVEDEEVYFVAGSFNDWNPAAEGYQMVADYGVYTLSFDLTAGDYSLKVTDGTWDNSWGGNGEGGNYDFKVVTDCTVTVTFEEGTVTVTGDGLEEIKPDPIVIESVSVAGVAGLTGAEWDPKTNVMTADNGIYTITFTGIAAGAYEFKFVANGNWSINWASGDRMESGETYDAWFNAMGNSNVVVETDGSDVTLTLDLTAMDVYTGEGAKCSVTVGTPVVGGTTVSGTVSSARGTTGTITVELWAEGAAAATYTATTEDGAYTIEGVAAGTYTMKVSKANHVTREYTVTVGAEAVAQDAKICLIGDVTGDGRVNAGDVAKLFTHVKGGAQLTDEYVLACANANGRALNISDVATIYAHVKGSKMLF